MFFVSIQPALPADVRIALSPLSNENKSFDFPPASWSPNSTSPPAQNKKTNAEKSRPLRPLTTQVCRLFYVKTFVNAFWLWITADWGFFLLGISRTWSWKRWSSKTDGILAAKIAAARADYRIARGQCLAGARSRDNGKSQLALIRCGDLLLFKLPVFSHKKAGSIIPIRWWPIEVPKSATTQP